MSTTEENKALVRRYWEEFFNKRNLAVIDELIAPNYVSHDSGGSESLGREAARQVATSTFGGFPDGTAFATLLMNICVPRIVLYTQPPVFGKKSKGDNP